MSRAACASYTRSAPAVSLSLTTNQNTGQANEALEGMGNLTGSAPSDTLSGNALANRLIGGRGAAVLKKLDGSDYLNSYGRVNGNDSLNGGAGPASETTDAFHPRSGNKHAGFELFETDL